MRMVLGLWSSKLVALKSREGMLGRAHLFSIAALIIATGLAVACGGSDVRVDRGRSLEVILEPVPIRSYDQVTFIDQSGQTQLIRPQATNRQLAAMKVTIVNRTSVTTSVLVNPEAAELGSRRSERVEALDPFENAAVVASVDISNPQRLLALNPASPDERVLWGEISLARDFQISGWMLFDVPKGLQLSTFWWNQIETIVVDL